jgi:hypothetical protein
MQFPDLSLPHALVLRLASPPHGPACEVLHMSFLPAMIHLLPSPGPAVCRLHAGAAGNKTPILPSFHLTTVILSLTHPSRYKKYGPMFRCELFGYEMVTMGQAEL